MRPRWAEPSGRLDFSDSKPCTKGQQDSPSACREALGSQPPLVRVGDGQTHTCRGSRSPWDPEYFLQVLFGEEV